MAAEKLVRMSKEQHAIISKMAKNESRTFAAQLKLIVEKGLPTCVQKKNQ